MILCCRANQQCQHEELRAFWPYFKAAIQRKDDDHLFYYGLALAYSKLGDLEGVEKNIDKAKFYAWDEEKKAYYDRVRDTLVNGTMSQ